MVRVVKLCSWFKWGICDMLEWKKVKYLQHILGGISLDKYREGVLSVVQLIQVIQLVKYKHLIINAKNLFVRESLPLDKASLTTTLLTNFTVSNKMQVHQLPFKWDAVETCDTSCYHTEISNHMNSKANLITLPLIQLTQHDFHNLNKRCMSIYYWTTLKLY